MSVRKGGQVVAGTPNITTGHHVGEIFWTSRLDNELNGAVDANGAVYSVEAYTGDKSVPELLRKGSLPYVSMTEYESIVSTYGSCRAWGWDNGDTFRVPLLKDVYLMAGQAESAGEFISESLPNITGSFNAFVQKDKTEGAFYGEGDSWTTASTSSTNGGVTRFNASRSSSAYQDGAKVRPDSVRYRAMVQLSTGVQEDATQLKEYKFNNPHFFGESKWTDVNPKNSSWLVSNGSYHSGRTYGDYYKWLLKIYNKTETVEGVSVKVVSDEYTDYDFVINTADTTFRLPLLNGEEDLPDYENGLSIASLPFTAKQKGTVSLKLTRPDLSAAVFVNGVDISSDGMPNQSGAAISTIFDVKKGDVVTANQAISRCLFFPNTGNGSLYFYVGDTLQDPALINAGHVLTDLATKTNSVQAASASMPSDRYIDLTVGASGATYTAPANGEVCMRARIDGTWGQAYIQRVEKDGTTAIGSYTAGADTSWINQPAPTLRLKKGDVFELNYIRATPIMLRFYYSEGEN